MPDSAHLSAIVQLCELVRRPNRRSLRVVVGHGWEELPQARRCGLADLEALPTEAVRERGREFLARAVDALAAHRQAPEGDISPIEALDRHVLAGDTWDVILAERAERGLVPLSERTLRNRQRDACALVEEWAHTVALVAGTDARDGFGPAAESGEAFPGTGGAPGAAPSTAAGVDQHRAPVRSRLLGAPLIVALFAVLVVAFGGATLSWTGAEDPPLPAPGAIGRPHSLDAPGSFYVPALADVLPDFAVPPVAEHLTLATLVPWDNDRGYAVVLSTRRGGAENGKAWLWDPDAEEVVWELAWTPPREEILTHATLEDQARQENWGIHSHAYSYGNASLEDRIAFTYLQRYSPAFVLFVDLQTGAPLWHYVHPGHLSQASVFDLNHDGRAELVLPGTDNAVNRASLVVLDPWRDRSGAASTVQWNEDGEAAIHRVLFPALHDIIRAHGQPRLHVRVMAPEDWLVEEERLVVTVGGVDGETAGFLCYLDGGWKATPGHAIVLSDAHRLFFEGLGLDPDELIAGLAEEIDLVPGEEFEEWRRAELVMH